MKNSDFWKDLDSGQKGEKIVYSFLEEKGLTYLHSNHDYKYDFMMSKNNKNVKYEVKTDYKQTNNHFVEFESSTDYGATYSDSGIRTSESEWYAFYYTMLGEVWFIKTEKLKSLVESHKFKIKHQAEKPETPAKGYIINRQKFKKYFHVHKL
jgi:hypothetical protein